MSWKNHCTVCNGSATAEQVNTAVSPSSLVSFCGLASITGAAVDTRLYHDKQTVIIIIPSIWRLIEEELVPASLVAVSV